MLKDIADMFEFFIGRVQVSEFIAWVVRVGDSSFYHKAVGAKEDLAQGPERVVALPELVGPSVTGLPEAADGFIPVDQHCQVRGVGK